MGLLPLRPISITFQASAVTVPYPLARLAVFLAEEFEWYDIFPDRKPNQVVPFDVLVAAGLNAFGAGGASVARMQGIQREMAERCDHRLSAIGVEENLVTANDLNPVIDLVLEATYAPRALASVATKILHRKRRHLVPILDKYL